MLTVWLRGKKPAPCWKALAEALTSTIVGFCVEETQKGII